MNVFGATVLLPIFIFHQTFKSLTWPSYWHKILLKRKKKTLFYIEHIHSEGAECSKMAFNILTPRTLLTLLVIKIPRLMRGEATVQGLEEKLNGPAKWEETGCDGQEQPRNPKRLNSDMNWMIFISPWTETLLSKKIYTCKTWIKSQLNTVEAVKYGGGSTLCILKEKNAG